MRKIYGGQALAYFAAMLLCLLLCREAKAHDFYTGWMMPTHPQKSCCNKQDCEEVQARKDGDGRYHAFIEGQWREIPPEIILDPMKPENKSPGGYHACWNKTTKELLCFREEEVKM